MANHIAYVAVDLGSVRRGGLCRTATCVCGWKGPGRSTLELAADDALSHERRASERKPLDVMGLMEAWGYIVGGNRG